MVIEKFATTGDESAEATFPVNGGTALARFDRPQSSGTTIAVIADPHLSPTDCGSLKVYHRTKQRFQMALADAHRLDVDGVLVAGDLTKDGTSRQFALADELLRTAPTPIHVLPGNHDVTGRGPVGSGTAFARRYGYEGYPVETEIHGVDIVSLDTTLAGGSPGGTLTDQTRRQLQERSDSTRPRVAVMHHPITPIPSPLDSALPDTEYRLQNPDATLDVLGAADVDMVVSGHLHWPFATEYEGVAVVGAPGCSSFPPSYLLVHFDSRGTTVTIVPLADRSGLTEAYEYAVENHQRGDEIRSAVENGYFDRFPMVDQQQAYVSDRDQPSLSRPTSY